MKIIHWLVGMLSYTFSNKLLNEVSEVCAGYCISTQKVKKNRHPLLAVI
jgi:hypothetical protein